MVTNGDALRLQIVECGLQIGEEEGSDYGASTDLKNFPQNWSELLRIGLVLATSCLRSRLSLPKFI
jgi:hypothetical protein